MMNAELVAADDQRIIIPIVYRNNYLAALKAMTDDSRGEPLIRTLEFAQRYAAAIPFDVFDEANFVMARTKAFIKPNQTDDVGLRLRILSNRAAPGGGRPLPASSRNQTEIRGEVGIRRQARPVGGPGSKNRSARPAASENLQRSTE